MAMMTTLGSGPGFYLYSLDVDHGDLSVATQGVVEALSIDDALAITRRSLGLDRITGETTRLAGDRLPELGLAKMIEFRPDQLDGDPARQILWVQGPMKATCAGASPLPPPEDVG